MEYRCQMNALEELKELATSDRHSILIEGFEGCGKSYLAHEYSRMLGIHDFCIVKSDMDSIRETIDSTTTTNSKIVLCIENLDCGVVNVSYALLKFLEEPQNNVYIVVTCRNRNKLPDTILSRSTVVTVSMPTESDLYEYAKSTNNNVNKVKNHMIWKCVKSFKDVDIVLSLTDVQLDYFMTLSKLNFGKESISNSAWKLMHYDDNTLTPINMVVTFIMELYHKFPYVQRCCIDCLSDLDIKRIATHAIISKLCMELKYLSRR